MSNSKLSHPLAIIILAAGKGTRMKSDLPKVLHRLKNKPLVEHVINTSQLLNPKKIVLIVGYKSEQVKEAIGDSVLYVIQQEQLGTGHAVKQGKSILKDFEGDILILYGDMPLITSKTLKKLINLHQTHSGPLTMLTITSNNPRGFGRIQRDENNKVSAIVEEADCTPTQLEIKELNVGVYCIQSKWLWANLPNIKMSAKGEYYLTDLVAIATQQGHTVEALVNTNLVETMGINTPEHLTEATLALENIKVERRT